MSNVCIPEDLWEEDLEAVIIVWFTSDGASVDEGDLLAEIMVEKVQYEIHAQASGKLSIVKEQEQVVAKGEIIATID
jgi:pyruvate/2-oxoglutarate dehydrogenase complex dihydrolipoamide acyltransferase (E2) component